MDPISGVGYGDERKSMEASEAQDPSTTPEPAHVSVAQKEEDSAEDASGTIVQKPQLGNTDEGMPEVEDALMTPRIRDWSSTHTPASFAPSAAVEETTLPQHRHAAADTGSQPEGYFPIAPPLMSHASTSVSEQSTSAGIADSASGYPPDPPSLSSPSTPSERASVSRDAAAESVVGPTYNPESTRPTSVPTFQSTSLSRRRDISDYPQYPNQSFAALQKHPAHPHPLRTRTSNPLHELSSTSSNVGSTGYLPHVPSGARTTGNTPAQSPGLFSPTFGKKTTTESEDGGYSTPMLHPTHLQAPKE